LCYVPPVIFGQPGVTLSSQGPGTAQAQSFHIAIADPAGIKRPIILCYVPAPEMIAGIELEVRRNIANELRQQGYISGDVYEKVVGGRSTTSDVCPRVDAPLQPPLPALLCRVGNAVVLSGKTREGRRNVS
jgi:hypothetical protein